LGTGFGMSEGEDRSFRPVTNRKEKKKGVKDKARERTELARQREEYARGQKEAKEYPLQLKVQQKNMSWGPNGVQDALAARLGVDSTRVVNLRRFTDQGVPLWQVGVLGGEDGDVESAVFETAERLCGEGLSMTAPDGRRVALDVERYFAPFDQTLWKRTLFMQNLDERASAEDAAEVARLLLAKVKGLGTGDALVKKVGKRWRMTLPNKGMAQKLVGTEVIAPRLGARVVLAEFKFNAWKNELDRERGITREKQGGGVNVTVVADDAEASQPASIPSPSQQAQALRPPMQGHRQRGPGGKHAGQGPKPAGAALSVSAQGNSTTFLAAAAGRGIATKAAAVAAALEARGKKPEGVTPDAPVLWAVKLEQLAEQRAMLARQAKELEEEKARMARQVRELEEEDARIEKEMAECVAGIGKMSFSLDEKFRLETAALEEKTRKAKEGLEEQAKRLDEDAKLQREALERGREQERVRLAQMQKQAQEKRSQGEPQGRQGEAQGLQLPKGLQHQQEVQREPQGPQSGPQGFEPEPEPQLESGRKTASTETPQKRELESEDTGETKPMDVAPVGQDEADEKKESDEKKPRVDEKKPRGVEAEEVTVDEAAPADPGRAEVLKEKRAQGKRAKATRGRSMPRPRGLAQSQGFKSEKQESMEERRRRLVGKELEPGARWVHLELVEEMRPDERGWTEVRPVRSVAVLHWLRLEDARGLAVYVAEDRSSILENMDRVVADGVAVPYYGRGALYDGGPSLLGVEPSAVHPRTSMMERREGECALVPKMLTVVPVGYERGGRGVREFFWLHDGIHEATRPMPKNV
jgi:hypothetical protein